MALTFNSTRQVFHDLVGVVQTTVNMTRDSLAAQQPISINFNGSREGLVMCIIGFVVAICIVNCLSGLVKKLVFSLWSLKNQKVVPLTFEEEVSSDEGIVLKRSKGEKKKNNKKKKKKTTTNTNQNTNVSVSCNAGSGANTSTPKRDNESSDDDEEDEEIQVTTRKLRSPMTNTTSSSSSITATAAAAASTRRASSVIREIKKVMDRFTTVLEEGNEDSDTTATKYRPGEEEGESKTPTTTATTTSTTTPRFTRAPTISIPSASSSLINRKPFVTRD